VWQCRAVNLWDVYFQHPLDDRRWVGVEVPPLMTGEGVVVTVATKLSEAGMADFARNNYNYVLLCRGKSWHPTATVATMCGIRAVSGCSMAVHILVKGGAPKAADEEAAVSGEKMPQTRDASAAGHIMHTDPQHQHTPIKKPGCHARAGYGWRKKFGSGHGEL